VPNFKAQRLQHFSGKWLGRKERRIMKNLQGFSLISFSKTSTTQLKYSKRIPLNETIQKEKFRVE